MSLGGTESAGNSPPGSPVLGRAEELREKAAFDKFVPHKTEEKIIAVDLDDVLSQTNQKIAEWHNETYGTDMGIDDFLYYYYWKNKYWGNPKETFDKVHLFHSATDGLFETLPIPGAKEGLEALRELGYKLVIVTARSPDAADKTWGWVNTHFPGMVENIICTGQFTDAHKKEHEVVTKLSKAQVCTELGAKLLIDDSSENALSTATATPPTPVLLFGDYEWNKRISSPADATEEFTFDIRLKANNGKQFWKEEFVPIPEGAPLYRVNDWKEVVDWVKTRLD